MRSTKTELATIRVCVSEQYIIKFTYEKGTTMYDELVIEERRKQSRGLEEGRRLYLEIPPPPPTKKEKVTEPKRVVEIDL